MDAQLKRKIFIEVLKITVRQTVGMDPKDFMAELKANYSGACKAARACLGDDCDIRKA